MNKPSTVEAYIAQFDQHSQTLLHKLRNIVLKAVPEGTEEVISYNMPTYKYRGNLFHFALFKAHIGLYPGLGAIKALAEQLRDYKTSKGAIQLPLDAELPEKLIREIVAFNVNATKGDKKPDYSTYREDWKECEEFMQRLIVKTALHKERKWGIDVFTYEGKNVIAWAGFKNFFSIWFYNGVFLQDPYKVLITASEGKTKSLRQWRFTDVSQMDEGRILEYIHESIQTVRDGKIVQPEPAPKAEVDGLFKSALDQDPALKEAFAKLSPGKQRDYIGHIAEAKQEKTKKARLEKIIPLILQGQGLHDKYRK